MRRQDQSQNQERCALYRAEPIRIRKSGEGGPDQDVRDIEQSPGFHDEQTCAKQDQIEKDVDSDRCEGAESDDFHKKQIYRQLQRMKRPGGKGLYMLQDVPCGKYLFCSDLSQRDLQGLCEGIEAGDDRQQDQNQAPDVLFEILSHKITITSICGFRNITA